MPKWGQINPMQTVDHTGWGHGVCGDFKTCHIRKATGGNGAEGA